MDVNSVGNGTLRSPHFSYKFGAGALIAIGAAYGGTGWGRIFTAQVLAENGVGGGAIQRLRRELLENPMFSKDRHAKQASAIMTYVSREVKLIKAMAPGGKAKDICFSAAALYMGILGETYLYENETEIAPLIKIANPEWYDKNIAPIPRHYGHSGAGSSGSWKPSN